MNLLVVGASGYIGVKLFALAANRFLATGTSTTDLGSLLTLRLDAPAEFDYSIINTSTVVMLTAAISAPDVCTREFERAWDVNVTGTASFIFQVIARGARVIFFSSDTVYGEQADDFDESAVCNPVGDYAVMKHEVEKLFLSNPAFKTIRLSYVFSKDDKFTKYLQGCCVRGEEAEIFHPFYRAVVHRDDVVRGAIALAERWDEFPQSIINFGGPEVLSRMEIASILKDSVFHELKFRQIEPDPEFFISRPRVIQMRSPILSLLLARPVQTLAVAAWLELH